MAYRVVDPTTGFRDALFPLRTALLHPLNLANVKRAADDMNVLITASFSDLANLLLMKYEMSPDLQVREVNARNDPGLLMEMLGAVNRDVLQELSDVDNQHRSLKADAHFQYAVATRLSTTRGYGYELAPPGTHVFDDPNNRYTNTAMGNDSMGIPMFR